MIKKALALISGGLDSMLACQLILEQGILVEGVNFFTGFTGINASCPKRATKNSHDAAWVAARLGIKLHVIDAHEKFKTDVMLNPKFGFGAHINPCLDCKIFMVNEAFRFMRENGFDFLITGEVIGQRAMSQRKDTMPLVAKNTEDLLLRPLSAKLLHKTLPEEKGWVDRNLLCDFSGRNRKPQIALAEKFGFKEFPQPAGGCVLTEDIYTARLQDFWKYKNCRDYNLDEILLMRLGRHLRPRANFKMIIGRDEEENNFLEKHKEKYVHMYSVSHLGPFVLLEGDLDLNAINFAAQITSFFGKGRLSEKVEVMVKNFSEDSFYVLVAPLQEIKSDWYIQ